MTADASTKRSPRWCASCPDPADRLGVAVQPARQRELVLIVDGCSRVLHQIGRPVTLGLTAERQDEEDAKLAASDPRTRVCSAAFAGVSRRSIASIPSPGASSDPPRSCESGEEEEAELGLPHAPVERGDEVVMHLVDTFEHVVGVQVRGSCYRATSPSQRALRSRSASSSHTSAARSTRTPSGSPATGTSARRAPRSGRRPGSCRPVAVIAVGHVVGLDVSDACDDCLAPPRGEDPGEHAEAGGTSAAPRHRGGRGSSRMEAAMVCWRDHGRPAGSAREQAGSGHRARGAIWAGSRLPAAGRGELDGKRDSVEPLADLGDGSVCQRRRGTAIGLARAAARSTKRRDARSAVQRCAVHAQLGRSEHRVTTATRHDRLARHTEQLPTWSRARSPWDWRQEHSGPRARRSPPMRCSQLSRTSSDGSSPSAAAIYATTGALMVVGVPRTASAARPAPPSTVTAASSTHHTPPGKRSITVAATAIAKRVLPTPPGPLDT